LLLLITTAYLKSESDLDFKIWDFATVTASDFTVEMHISETMWNTFVDMHKQELEMGNTTDEHGHKHTILFSFKQYLAKELLGRLNPFKHVIEETTELQIANINFAFNNPEMLALL
jgi:hypothetical protein